MSLTPHNREANDISDGISVSTFDLYASTTAAVRESSFQASFAEQTASEMKQILDYWGSQNTAHAGLKNAMERNSLHLLDEGIQKHRSAITTSPSKLDSSLIHGKIENLSPTNTVETEMSDSESEISATALIQELKEGFCLNESLVSNEDESPQVSFYPSSEVLQQSTQVDFVILNTERQGWEAEQTLHSTLFDAVIVELKHKSRPFRANDNTIVSKSEQNQPEAAQKRRRLVSKKKLRLFIRCILLPVVISLFVAKMNSSFSDNTIWIQW